MSRRAELRRLSEASGPRVQTTCRGSTPPRSAQPPKEEDHAYRRDERPPPDVEAERAECRGARLHERHNCRCPRKTADEVQCTEFERFHFRIRARDRNRRAEARQEAAENWNKYLRERAEMDNFRKRQERIATDRLQREKKELFQKILGVMDNVERALAYQDTMDRQGLQQALRMVMWQMNEVMRAEGLTPVPTVGEVFDPYVHEAIEAVEGSDQPEGTILEEVLKGYKLGDETLRPARVKVSAGNKQAQM